MSTYCPLALAVRSAANQEKPGERLREERLEEEGRERREVPPTLGLRSIQAPGAEQSPGRKSRRRRLWNQVCLAGSSGRFSTQGKLGVWGL